jgi:hypothetical protein
VLPQISPEPKAISKCLKLKPSSSVSSCLAFLGIFMPKAYPGTFINKTWVGSLGEMGKEKEEMRRGECGCEEK